LLALQKALTSRIVDARKRLKTVAIPYDFRVKISAICSELNVDGIRGDIVTNRAAKALASFEGRDEVAVEDIYRWVVNHRLTSFEHNAKQWYQLDVVRCTCGL
jgi:magnesium chelatase subunit I